MLHRADADGAAPPADAPRHGGGLPPGHEAGGAAGRGGAGAGLSLPGPAARLPPDLLRRHEGAAARLGGAAWTQELPGAAHRRRPAPAGGCGWQSHTWKKDSHSVFK